MTPWATEVTRVGDVVHVSFFLSLDPAPPREFKPFLDVDLDEEHATELLVNRGKALEELRRIHRPAIRRPRMGKAG